MSTQYTVARVSVCLMCLQYPALISPPGNQLSNNTSATLIVSDSEHKALLERKCQ